MKKLQIQLSTGTALLAGALGLVACVSTENGHSTYGGSNSSTGSSTPTTTGQGGASNSGTVNASATKSSTAKSSSRAAAATLALPTGDPSTSALLMELYSPSEVQAGQTFDSEIQVTNLADIALENVQVTSSIDDNFVMASSTPAVGNGPAGQRVWNLGKLGAGETRTIAMKGSAKSTPMVGTCLSASYNSSICMQIPVVSPKLAVTATGTADALACDQIIYKYVVTNTGSGEARDVVLDPKLPAGLAIEKGSAGVQRLGTLKSGQSREITFTLKADKAGNFEHVASASAEGGLTAQAPSVKTVITKPTLKLDCTGTDKQFSGREVAYEFNVTNTGTGLSRNSTLQVNLPTGFKFKSADNGGTIQGGKVRWALGDMKAGEAKKVGLKATAVDQGDFTLTSSLNGDCAEPINCETKTSVVGIPALLLEVVDVEDPIVIGQEETYVIEVTNQGTATARNVAILVTVPANCEYVSATGQTAAVGAPGSDGKLKLAAVPTLAPKAKATWRIVLRGVKPADARFAVEMTSDELTSPVNETEATTYYQ